MASTVSNGNDRSEKWQRPFTKGKFDEAAGFWRELWEQKGTGDPSARWLTEIKSAIHRRVRPSTETEWFLDMDEAAEVIRTKQVFGGRRHIHCTKL